MPTPPSVSAHPPRITAAVHSRLSEELDRLVNVERPRFSVLKQEARTQGRIEENADYWAVSEDEDRMERRISEIKDLLQAATVLDDGAAPSGVVAHGTLVTLDFGDGDHEDYLVATRYERSGADVDICTPDSPMGAVLMGTKPGDEVSFHTPTGTNVSVTVVDVAG